jgi:hypothetical protein
MKKRILALLAAMTGGGGILDFPKGSSRKNWSGQVQGKRETERRMRQIGKLKARKEKEDA